MRCAYPLRSSRPSTPAREPAVTGRTPTMNYSFAEPLDLDDEHEVNSGSEPQPSIGMTTDSRLEAKRNATCRRSASLLVCTALGRVVPPEQ